MDIRKSRWLYLTVFCTVNLFAGSFYAWSVFSGPLAARLSALTGTAVTAADLGLIFSLASAVNPFAMVAGGWVNDRFGPRAVITAGGIMIGGGLILSSLVESVLALTLVYGIVFGLGVGLTYTSTIGSSIKYFPDRRGLAGGISSMSYGLSSIILPPVASALILALGIEQTLLILGSVTGCVIVAGGLLSRRCPDGIALMISDGGNDSKKENAPAAARSRPDMNWREMIATPVFWCMLLFFVTGSTGALMLISSAATIAQQQIGLSVAASAGAVSLLAIMNASGRFIAGFASDRFGRIPTLFLCLTSAVSGLLLLHSAGTGSAALFFTGISLVALCYGGFVGIYPGFTVDEFGAKHNSVNYGIMAAGFSSGGILGPWILKLTAASGGYAAAYEAALAVCAAGFVLGALCARLQRNHAPGRRILHRDNAQTA